MLFYSYDDWVESIDMLDALHPQTILAYGMNGRDLPFRTAHRCGCESNADGPEEHQVPPAHRCDNEFDEAARKETFRTGGRGTWGSRSSRLGMLKHIGIVAVSAEGAALCYRTICAEGARPFRFHRPPRIFGPTFPPPRYLSESSGQIGERGWEASSPLHRGAASAGADLLICSANTAHQGLDLSPLPWLHIAEEVGQVAVDRGCHRLLILGTSFLMESRVYTSKLHARGFKTFFPPPKMALP